MRMHEKVLARDINEIRRQAFNSWQMRGTIVDFFLHIVLQKDVCCFFDYQILVTVNIGSGYIMWLQY